MFENSDHPVDFESLDRDPVDGDADPDLGRRMGRDARRVAAGEMSEAAFYEKYHEEVLAEFDRDDRPVATEEDP